MSLTISNTGINLIKQFEGCRLSAYKDVIGVLTIGYGWTKPIDGKPLTKDTRITQAKADSLLKEGLKSYENKVNKYDHKYHWNQNQFDALVSFCYNIGNIDGLTANGTRTIDEIANKYEYYNRAGGKVYAGLTRRRNAEKQLFITPVSPVSSVSSDSFDTDYTYNDFVKEVQSSLGAKADGIAGTETLSKTVTVSMKQNNRHAVVIPIQKYLNSIGYNCGAVDGIAGVKFDAAVKTYQRANGCVPDGEITAKKNTWKKLLQIK